MNWPKRMLLSGFGKSGRRRFVKKSCLVRLGYRKVLVLIKADIGQ